MARKSSKSTPASSVRSSSKRPAPDQVTPSRQSKRTKGASAKTSYIEPDTDNDENESNESMNDETEGPNTSDYEEGGAKDSSSDSISDEVESENENTVKKVAPRGRPAKTNTLPTRKKQADEKNLWKSGVKLEPGTQIIIKKPKAREAGDTPYTDDTIHPNTMLFLEDLATNNERQWLKVHDPDYRTALQDFTTFLEKLTEKIVEIDETIPELPVKDIIFRIYRDVRFSKDQTPYKTHFSAAWSRTGRKGPYAAYYVQVKPGGGSFVGGGLWQPDAQPLSLIRRDIDRKPHRIKGVLTDTRLRKAFFGGIGDDEKKAVKAFVNQSENKATALKKHPKGYENDHRDIELLRLRSFTLGVKLADQELVGPKGLGRITELISSMVPFVTYLNSVVMPDEESEESEESDEANGEED